MAFQKTSLILGRRFTRTDLGLLPVVLEGLGGDIGIQPDRMNKLSDLSLRKHLRVFFVWGGKQGRKLKNPGLMMATRTPVLNHPF